MSRYIFCDYGAFCLTPLSSNDPNNHDKGTWTSLYPNNAQLVITYEGKLTDTTNINANDRNDVTFTPYVDSTNNGDDDDDDDDDDDTPWSEPFTDHAEIKTYAAALKKVDGSASDAATLAGAKFKFTGLTATKGEDGVYTVTSTTATAGTETELEVDANGMLYIIGLAEDAELTGEETAAPSGYNKLTGTVTLTPQVMEEEIFTTSGVRYYDAHNNLVSESVTGGSSKTVSKNLSDLDADAVTVVNNKGTELPSTGGIGTTIFYVIGAVLVIGAGVVLVTRRRMDAK